MWSAMLDISVDSTRIWMRRCSAQAGPKSLKACIEQKSKLSEGSTPPAKKFSGSTRISAHLDSLTDKPHFNSPFEPLKPCYAR